MRQCFFALAQRLILRSSLRPSLHLSLHLSLGFCCVLFGLFFITACEESSSGNSSDSGSGGSTARVAVVDDYLYAIVGEQAGLDGFFGRSDLQVFRTENPADPVPWIKMPLDWGVETLFPFGDYLLLGADDGLHIIDNTDRANPVYLTKFDHARARDPVVALGNYAYVTLDGGFAAASELLVIDISDIRNPALLKTYAMQQPGGLAVSEEELFVCDGAAGLKIFSRADPVELEFTESLSNVDCNDVIVQSDTLIAITDTELLQFDHADFPAILISRIE